MKNVLVITYYWPPSGGSGVQRWLKMTKYFPENNWRPIIYAPENPEYPVEDLSLEKDIAPETIVLKQPIIEPYSFYKKFLGIKKEQTIKAGFINDSGKKNAWKENLSVWIRGNFFIPDARCLWIKPSVKYLLKYLKDNPVDAIISTGPPHSMHIIGMKLHKKTNVPWIADFRDPWTDIDYYQDLKLSHCADRKHHRLEKKVLTNANKVVSIGWNMASPLEKIRGEAIDIIPNGYDNDIKCTTATQTLSNKFTITHIGIITPSRNIETFWEALSELTTSNKELADNLEIKLIGSIDNSVRQSLEKFEILKFATLIDNLPHDAVIEQQCSSSVLLLLINRSPSAKGILTGKLFEYLYANRPIIAIGPEGGDAAKILAETSAGTVIDFDNKDKMKEEILQLFSLHKENQLVGSNNEVAIEKYSRRHLSKQYAELLNSIAQI